MRITTQIEYALRCLFSIATGSAKKTAVSIAVIARDQRLPVDYIEQLLMKLRRKKLVKSVRGPRGGYVLGRPAESITIKQVIEAVEGEVFEVICERKKRLLKGHKGCSRRCALRKVWVDLKECIEKHLGRKTLAGLLAGCKGLQKRDK